MMSELSKKSWIQTQIRIIMEKVPSRPIAGTYLQKKFEHDISKTVTCRARTNRQTNKHTNERSNILARFRK